LAKSGTAKKSASASRSAVKTMETPKRADKNDEVIQKEQKNIIKFSKKF
jgi:hypothetical protein